MTISPDSIMNHRFFKFDIFHNQMFHIDNCHVCVSSVECYFNFDQNVNVYLILDWFTYVHFLFSYTSSLLSEV